MVATKGTVTAKGKVSMKGSVTTDDTASRGMVQPAPYRFTVDDYEAMGRAGILPEDARVELLKGEIYAMTPVGPAHVRALLGLQRALDIFRDQALVSVQNPLRLENSEPEPDLALLRLPLDRYDDRLPHGEDVLLIIEVADTSLLYDRNKKLPIYAAAGIPEVWILDLNDRQLEVYRKPQGARYTSLTTYAEGERAAPLEFPEQALEWWS